MSGCEAAAEESQIPLVTVPVAAQGEFIVGVICHGNKRDTEGFDASHIEAIRAAADGLGVSTVRISDEVEGDVAVRKSVEASTTAAACIRLPILPVLQKDTVLFLPAATR